MSEPTAIRIPGRHERWRCAGCGNLTRFEVVRTQTSSEYWHVDLSGEPAVDDTRTLSDSVASVTCRWCGRSDAIEYVPRTAVEPAPDAADAG